MNNFEFYSPTEFVFGRGAELRAGELARRHGGSRVLLVYGSERVASTGLLPSVEAALQAEGLATQRFGGVMPNPTDTCVYAGIEAGRRFAADMVLAVGGGSVIDAAKAMAAGLNYEGDFWDFWEGRAEMQAALPVGVVLTIPAAGSEGSGNSVITQESTLRKVSLRTPRALRPRFALMNPELTFSLPAFQTAAGATDMMAHIMERYFTNTPHTEVTDALAEALLRTIIDTVPRVLAAPFDYDARAALMWCGTLAHNGLCGTGNEEDWACHGMEHELSAFYGVTHGAGLAVVFPAFLTFATPRKAGRVAQWARNVWGVSPKESREAEAKEGVERFKAFLRAIGMPVSIAQLGIADFDLERINAHVHVTKGRVFGNFIPLGEAESREVYRLAVEG